MSRARPATHANALLRTLLAALALTALPLAAFAQTYPTIYLEQNARMQFQATVLAGPGGPIVFMDDAEVQANVSWQNYERAWELWKAKALAKLGQEEKGTGGKAG